MGKLSEVPSRSWRWQRVAVPMIIALFLAFLVIVVLAVAGLLGRRVC